MLFSIHKFKFGFISLKRVGRYLCVCERVYIDKKMGV